MHGGYRKNAGRKKGSNDFGEPTYPVRVPISFVNTLKNHLQLMKDLKNHDHIFFPSSQLTDKNFPYFSSTVSAGFPSPADDHMENTLDLNRYLIYNQETTFFLRVKGDSMINAHIMEDDLLIVDRSLKPKHYDIVIAVIHGDITVKRLIILQDKNIILKAENPDYPDIPIQDPESLIIWGVVTNVIHKIIQTRRIQTVPHDRSY